MSIKIKEWQLCEKNDTKLPKKSENKGKKEANRKEVRYFKLI